MINPGPAAGPAIPAAATLGKKILQPPIIANPLQFEQRITGRLDVGDRCVTGRGAEMLRTNNLTFAVIRRPVK